MKNIYLSLIAVIVITQFSFAQTNTFPSSGSVGIGTLTPIGGSILDIETNANGTSNGVIFHNASSGSAARTRFTLQNDVNYVAMNLNGSQYTTDPNLFQIFAPASIAFGISGVEQMRMTGLNIGVGLAAPVESFTITNTANIINQSTLGLYRAVAGGTISSGATAGQMNLGVYNSTSATTSYGAQLAAIATENWTPGTAQGTALVFRTTANTTATVAERMRIDNNGNVGIGTTNPSSILYMQRGANQIVANKKND